MINRVNVATMREKLKMIRKEKKRWGQGPREKERRLMLVLVNS